MNQIRLLGALDPGFGWTGTELILAGDPFPRMGPAGYLRGAYASLSIEWGSVRMVRDPLGLGKLFWAIDPDGTLLFSARPWRLVEAGCGFGVIQAVPPGTAIQIDLEGEDDRLDSLPAPHRSSHGRDPERPIEAIATEIRDTLDRYCAALASAHPQARVFVCLSGGLDSTGVAVLARRHFRDVVAISFDLLRPNGSASADRRTAKRLATDLGLSLFLVTPTPDELLEGLDVVLRDGIDWRDFNVHAGLVNLALASGIAAAYPTGQALVLTGDFPNEYLVDYHAETLGGQTYYALPRLSPTALQAALVRGLETSHRETGPFQAWNLPLVQIYGPAVDHYLALPASFLADPQRKERLSRLMFGDAIPDYVYSRPKTRAQIGDPEGDGGVLGLCLARGIDGMTLRRRFAHLHHAQDSELDRFIRGGRYAASVPQLARVP
jgi:asparagine synthetase B (glutamine-hydrolysing)